MSQENGLNPGDRELEDALRTLAPAVSRIDPVGAAFEAGRRAGRRQLRVWQTAATVLLLVSAAVWAAPRSGIHSPNVGALQAPTFATRALESTNKLSQLPRAASPRPSASLASLQRVVREHDLYALPTTLLPAVRATRAGETF